MRRGSFLFLASMIVSASSFGHDTQSLKNDELVYFLPTQVIHYHK
ncbi:hypothetical protein VRK_33380 [Vibrio sp. MEBiC08052]|nr:hypothetical protein VRK_33380 [Vibrio sp. MEBiC08052]